MRAKILFSVTLVFVALGLFIISCEKENNDTTTPDTETTSAIDNAKTDETVSQMFSTVNHYGINEEGIKNLEHDSTYAPCAVVSIDNIALGVWPKTLTIDFGTVGCTCKDGKIRKGKLICVFSGRWSDNVIVANTYASVTCQNFYVNGNKVEGTYTITYTGRNSSNGPSFTQKAENAKLTLTTGKIISWNSTKTIDWTAGFATPLDITDDIYYVDGTSTGTNSDGKTYTVDITKPLKQDMTCNISSYGNGMITEGTCSITPQDLAARTVDFGTGSCDNDATVTISGVTIPIKL